MKLGLALGGGSDVPSWQRGLRLVELAESLGLHSIWVPEGHFRRGATPSPLVALAAFAARTERLRLGTTSLLLPIHPALRIAEEVATLDRLSGGRVILGLGRGFQAPVFRAFGVAASEKRDRFDATLDAILELWANADDAGAPLQKPHPPLVVAAFGRRGLTQAARRGLPYLASPLEGLPVLEENYAFHRDQLQGELRGELKVPVMRTVHVTDDEREAARLYGALEAQNRNLRPSTGTGALARAAAGPIEDRVVIGTAAEVTDQLAVYRDRLQADLIIVRPALDVADEEACSVSLERLAREVMPALASA